MYTDNQHRWMEITGALSQVDKAKESLWEPLAKCMSSLDFIYEINPIVNLQMRKAGKMGLIRDVLRKIFMSIQSENDPSHIAILAKSLSEELKDAHKKSLREWSAIQKKKEECAAGGVPTYNYNGKMDCVIPTNGFSINTVHRLLLSYGNITYLKSVPMAMLINRRK